MDKPKTEKRFCFNCGNHILIDGSFDGGVIQCTVSGKYIDLMEIAPEECTEYKDKEPGKWTI